MAEANKLFSFTLPSPYQAELAKIADQQRMAEMLQAQSQAPIERYSYKGIEARTPATAGLAKLLQGFGGAYFQGQAREKEKALGEKYSADQSADFTSLAKMLSAPAVAGSAAVPETIAAPPTFAVDDEGQPMPGISAAPAVPAVTARRAGQIDPEMIGQFKTREAQQMAMAQLLAQIGPEKLTEVGKGGSLFSQKLGKVVFTAPTEEEYGTTPQIEKNKDSPTGYVAVVYSKNGTRKVIGPADPVNQFTTPSVDAQAKLAQDRAISDRNFTQLSLAERTKFDLEGKRLNISGAELFFNTGMKAGGAAPLPPAGAPSMLPVPGGTPATPNQPVGQPVAPVAVPPAPRIGMAPRSVPVPVSAPAIPLSQPNATLPGKFQAQIIVDSEKQKKELENKSEFNARGFNAAVQEARNILSGTAGKNPDGTPAVSPLPTGSGIGAGLDWVASLAGSAPKGVAEADKLRVIGGILTSKVPRMEGPQSNVDVQLYRETAGQVGDATLPRSRRLAALDTVERLLAKYEKFNRDEPQIGVPGAVPLQPFQGQNRRAPDANVIQYNDQGVRQ